MRTHIIFAGLLALAAIAPAALAPLAAHAGQNNDLNKLRAQAEAGEPSAQLKLGTAYALGRGVAARLCPRASMDQYRRRFGA